MFLTAVPSPRSMLLKGIGRLVEKTQRYKKAAKLVLVLFRAVSLGDVMEFVRTQGPRFSTRTFL